MAETFGIDDPSFEPWCTTDRNEGEVDRSRTWWRWTGRGDRRQEKPRSCLERTSTRFCKDGAADVWRSTARFASTSHTHPFACGPGAFPYPRVHEMGSPQVTFNLAGHVTTVHSPPLGFVDRTPADAPHTPVPRQLGQGPAQPGLPGWHVPVLDRIEGADLLDRSGFQPGWGLPDPVGGRRSGCNWRKKGCICSIPEIHWIRGGKSPARSYTAPVASGSPSTFESDSCWERSGRTAVPREGDAREAGCRRMKEGRGRKRGRKTPWK